MKFFKHFTDSHRGQSMRTIMRKYGHAGIGRYWTLIEICAEKLEKSKEQEFTEEHCKFEFHWTYIRDTLATHQRSATEMYLRCLSDVGLMSFECIGDVVTIYMPKLLESMDRDSKRARKEHTPSAPKKKIKKEEIEIEDKDKEEILDNNLKPNEKENGEKSSEGEKGNPEILTRIDELAYMRPEFQPYIESLKGLEVYNRTFQQKLELFKKRWDTVEAFDQWVGNLSQRPNFKKIETREAQKSYMAASIKNQIEEMVMAV